MAEVRRQEVQSSKRRVDELGHHERSDLLGVGLGEGRAAVGAVGRLA